MNINSVLLELGFLPSLVGFGYITDAAKIVGEIPYEKMENVYDRIATLRRSTRGQVERNIRHSIQNAWGRTRFDKLEAVGVKFQVKPTTKEFIHILAMFITKKI
jgi:hypothetical protein